METWARFECAGCGAEARVARRTPDAGAAALARLLQHVACPTCGRVGAAAQARLATHARRRAREQRLRWMAPALGAVAGLLHDGFVHRGAGAAAWAAVGVTLVTFGVYQQPHAPPVPPGEVALEVVTANGRTETVRGIVARSPPPPRGAETLAAIALVVGFACNLVALLAVASTWDLQVSPQDTALLLLLTL